LVLTLYSPSPTAGVCDVGIDSTQVSPVKVCRNGTALISVSVHNLGVGMECAWVCWQLLQNSVLKMK